MTDIYLQSFSVPFEYPVYFTTDAFAPDNETVVGAIRRLEPDRRHRVLAIVDQGLEAARPGTAASVVAYAEFYRDSMELAGDPEIVPGGEPAKQGQETSNRIVERIHDSGIDRKSVVVILGGGAVLDAAGYAAATAHRGVRTIRVPTTVEGQCDSGVGVKTAVNSLGIKNFVGSFTPPFAVVNDDRFIDTLPDRDRRAGMAEAVKVALLRAPGFFEWIWDHSDALATFDPGAINTLIRRTAELHLEHIGSCGDPFESGDAKPLDFGHWSAHKIESLTNYEVRHGEAVAIGLALDCRYAAESGLLDERVVARVCVLLERLGFALWHPALDMRNGTRGRAIMYGLEEFREHLGGDLTLTLIEGIGNPLDVADIDASRMESAVQWLEFRNGSR
jgi:3-dehydroquinate synthase